MKIWNLICFDIFRMIIWLLDENSWHATPLAGVMDKTEFKYQSAILPYRYFFSRHLRPHVMTYQRLVLFIFLLHNYFCARLLKKRKKRLYKGLHMNDMYEKYILVRNCMETNECLNTTPSISQRSILALFCFRMIVTFQKPRKSRVQKTILPFWFDVMCWYKRGDAEGMFMRPVSNNTYVGVKGNNDFCLGTQNLVNKSLPTHFLWSFKMW